MLTFITIIHLLVALLLIVLVLIQDSKGGAMGGMLGGGGSNSLLGATGATSFLVKLTRGVAIVFAATCIFLTIQSTNQSKSVIDGFIPPAAETAAGGAANTDGKESAESGAKENAASPESDKAEDTDSNN